MPHGDLGTEPGSYDGPIVITSGGTYSGNWLSDGAGNAVTIETDDPVIIEDSYVKHRSGIGIYGAGGSAGIDLTLRNSRILGSLPTVSGRTYGRSVFTANTKRWVIENNWFQNTGTLIAAYKKGGAGQPMRIRYNRFRNINGQYVNGSGGFQTGSEDHELTPCLQFHQMHGLSACEIAWNEFINTPLNAGAGTGSRIEDTISLHRSSGADTSNRIKIHHNLCWGAFPAAPGYGFSGGGIMICDGFDAADPPSGLADAYENVVLGTVNYGIAIAAGRNSRGFSNRVVGSGRNSSNQLYTAANIGVYVWDYGGDPRYANNQMYDNHVRWWNGSSRDDAWVPDCTGSCSPNTGSPSGQVTYAHETAEYDTWLNTTVALAGINLGPQDGGTGEPGDSEPVTRDRVWQIDARMIKTSSKTVSVDALAILKERSRNFNIDARMSPTKTFGVDAITYDPLAKDFSVDALITNIVDYDFEFRGPELGWEFSGISSGGAS